MLVTIFFISFAPLTNAVSSATIVLAEQLFQNTPYDTGCFRACQDDGGQSGFCGEQKGMFCTQMRREQVAFFQGVSGGRPAPIDAGGPLRDYFRQSNLRPGQCGAHHLLPPLRPAGAARRNLLVFKVQDAWAGYVREHPEEAARDRGFAIACYVYEKRELFALLHRQKLLTVLMRAFEALVLDEDAGAGRRLLLGGLFSPMATLG